VRLRNSKVSNPSFFLKCWPNKHPMKCLVFFLVFLQHYSHGFGLAIQRTTRVFSPSSSKTTLLRATSNRSSPEGSDLLSAIDRKIIASLGAIGVAETGWINAQKFGLFAPNMDKLCTGAAVSCSEVLNGHWSEVFGVPLTVPGMLAYASIVALALAPLAFNGVTSANGGSPNSIEAVTQKGLLALTTAMTCFSAYLVSILAFKIGSPCPWCLLSASLSVALCVLTWAKSGSAAHHLKIGLSSATTTILACFVIYIASSTEIALADAQAYLDNPAVATQLYSPPPITKSSSQRALKIASLLKEKNTRFYGAYWCSHCYDQKQLLGVEAMKQLPYVECAKDGENSQRKLCLAKKIPGYPTWEVDGKFYPGESSLNELEDIALGRSPPPPPP